MALIHRVSFGLAFTFCSLGGCASDGNDGGSSGSGSVSDGGGGASSSSGGMGVSIGGAATSGGASGAKAPGGAGVGGLVGAAGKEAAGGGGFAGATGVAGASAGTSGAALGGGANAAGIGGAAAGSGGMGGAAAGSGGVGGNDYQPCPTNGSACALLPLGDSITEGFGSSGAGYRVELFSQAVQHGKHLTFVGSLQNGPATVQNQAFPKHHEGHDGYTIDSGTGYSGISGSITDQALGNYHPNIVLLMIGTNDINGNIDVGTAPNRLGKLIDDINTRAPDALVVVATIIPIANAGTNQKVLTYNAAIPGLVSSRAAQGKHVVLLDNYAAFSRDPSYQSTLMYNYLHPNDAGYAVLGRAFFGAIQTLLP